MPPTRRKRRRRRPFLPYFFRVLAAGLLLALLLTGGVTLARQGEAVLPTPTAAAPLPESSSAPTPLFHTCPCAHAGSRRLPMTTLRRYPKPRRWGTTGFPTRLLWGIPDGGPLSLLRGPARRMPGLPRLTVQSARHRGLHPVNGEKMTALRAWSGAPTGRYT